MEGLRPLIALSSPMAYSSISALTTLNVYPEIDERRQFKINTFLDVKRTHVISSPRFHLAVIIPALVRIVLREYEPVPSTKNFSDANFMLAELSTRRAVEVMDICFCLKAEDNTVIMRQKRRIDSWIKVTLIVRV